MLEALYKDSISVLRNTRTLDSGGTYTESAVIDSSIIGLIVPVSGKSGFKYMQGALTETTHRFYTSNSSDIIMRDKLLDNGTLTTYEVLSIEKSTLGSNPHQEIELKAASFLEIEIP